METVSYGLAFAPWLPMILLVIPFIFLNGIIAKRKGKNKIKYILLSFIPPLGLFISIYLVSFLDKDTQDKINKIYEKIS